MIETNKSLKGDSMHVSDKQREIALGPLQQKLLKARPQDLLAYVGRRFGSYVVARHIWYGKKLSWWMRCDCGYEAAFLFPPEAFLMIKCQHPDHAKKIPPAETSTGGRTQDALAALADQKWRRRRDAYLRRHFGITLKEYHKLLEAQGRSCFMCGKPHKNRPNGALVVNYGLSSHEVRGLLCRHCNWLLHEVEDDPTTLERGTIFIFDPPAPAALEGVRRIPKNRGSHETP